MANTVNQEYAVNSGAGFAYLARITGNNGSDITPDAIASITRTITDTLTNTSSTASIDPDETVYDELQTDDPRWTLAGGTSEGYNFADVIPASAIPSRRKYTLQYTFTPEVGEVFKTREIDVIGD